VRGLLSNPNNELALNFVPLRTLAAFANGGESWDARAAYLEAMKEWRPRFETIGSPITLADLVLLGDCFYLPHTEGPEAEAMVQRAHDLMGRSPAGWRDAAGQFLEASGRLRACCARTTELRQRPLFHALRRRVWELREELERLETYVRHQAGLERTGAAGSLQLPPAMRDGMIARLQRLWARQPDGTIAAARLSGGGTVL